MAEHHFFREIYAAAPQDSPLRRDIEEECHVGVNEVSLPDPQQRAIIQKNIPGWERLSEEQFHRAMMVEYLRYRLPGYTDRIAPDAMFPGQRICADFSQKVIGHPDIPEEVRALIRERSPHLAEEEAARAHHAEPSSTTSSSTPPSVSSPSALPPEHEEALHSLQVRQEKELAELRIKHEKEARELHEKHAKAAPAHHGPFGSPPMRK